MTGQYIVQGIFALAGITSLLASLLNWNWFFTTRNAQTIVRNVRNALVIFPFFTIFVEKGVCNYENNE